MSRTEKPKITEGGESGSGVGEVRMTGRTQDSVIYREEYICGRKRAMNICFCPLVEEGKWRAVGEELEAA